MNKFKLWFVTSPRLVKNSPSWLLRLFLPSVIVALELTNRRLAKMSLEEFNALVGKHRESGELDRAIEETNKIVEELKNK